MDLSQELNITYLIFVGTVIIFMLVTSIVVFFYIYQKRLYKQQQEMNAIVIHHQEELLYANWEVIEEERKRLSKEFHDDIGSIFSTLSLTLGKLDDQEISPASVEQVMHQSLQLIDNGIKNMHRILYDIVPPDIDIFGLSNTIMALCERINTTPNLYISYNESGVPAIHLNKQQELILYRIVQELINNTIKHSGADKADIELQWKNNELHLRYQDNGSGFNSDTLEKNGLGLRNIESRAKMMGAAFLFTPAAEQGMSFSLTLTSAV